MHGLYLVWWVQEKQLPAPLVAAILGATDLAVAALEIPTGWFADRFGHRASLILGSAIQVVGMIWCWLGDGISGMVTACLLVAVGDGFRSGADEALLFRTTEALGDRSAFQRIEARTETAQLVGLVALILAGGAIVHAWGYVAGWIAEVLLCGAGLGCALAMIEPPESGEDDNAATANGGAIRTLATARMAAAILPGAILSGAEAATTFIVQATSASAMNVTLFTAATTLLEAAGAATAWRLAPRVGASTQVAIGVAGIVLIACALLVPHALVPATAAICFLLGLCGPARAAAVQAVAGAGVRARASSLASACDLLMSTLLLPLGGLWAARRSRR